MTIHRNRCLKIDNKIVHEEGECFVIAEIGNNHQGDLSLCKKMFEVAKECGVDAVKLQKRANKKLYTTHFYRSPYHSENAYGPTYGRHREALEFGKNEYLELKEHARKLGLIFFATAFDFESADFLNEIGVPCFKIASGDLTNIHLLEYVAKIGKPMIISTGGASMKDVKRAYKTVSSINKQIAILQCTSTYPNEFSHLNLKVIESYRKRFSGHIIGWSAHDSGIAMAIAAFVYGARIIEKHFTLNRAMKGTDHAFSLEPAGMRKLVRDLRRVRVALGDGRKKKYPHEAESIKKLGKMIVAAKTLRKGHIIEKKDLAFKSPAEGLLPYHADYFYGKKLKKTVYQDEPLKRSHV